MEFYRLLSLKLLIITVRTANWYSVAKPNGELEPATRCTSKPIFMKRPTIVYPDSFGYRFDGQ